MSNERKACPMYAIDVPATPAVIAALDQYADALAELQLFLRECFKHESYDRKTVSVGELQVRLRSRTEQAPTSYNASAANELDALMRAASHAERHLACMMHFSHDEARKAVRDPASDDALFANTDCLDLE